MIKQIHELVSKGDWIVLAINADPCFTYTVGLHTHGLPEMIISLVPHQKAHRILNHCGMHMLEHGQFKHGEVTPELANYPSTIIDVNPINKKDYFCQVYNYYKTWDFKCQQIVASDIERRFPWDEGYNIIGQEILGESTSLKSK